MSLADFTLPIMPPDPSEGGSSGGLPLFSMSASVGIDANAFNSGIASLTASINTLNATVTTLLSTIGSTADGIASNLSGIATAATGVDTQLDAILADLFTVGKAATGVDATVDGIASDLSGIGTAASTAATTAGTALNGLDTSIAKTLDSIDDLDDDFETVGTDFDVAAKAIEKAGGEATTAGKDLSAAVDKVSESTKTGTLKFEDFAKAAGKAWTAVKNVAAAAWEIGTALIEPAVAYQQRQRTYEMAFGGIKELASEKMEELVKYTGYYEGILQGTFARMQSQFMSAGYSQADAIEYSTSAMKLAADAAAAYGISLDDATYKVMSFLRGNTEAGESIGLFATEQSRNAKANEMYGQGWKNLNESERQAVLLAMAQETYGSSGKTGLATNYSDSFLVAQANLKQRWADILGKLGTPILEAVSPVLSELAKTLETQEIQEAIDSLAKGISAFLTNLADAFIELLDAVREDPTIVTDFFAMLTDLINALAELAKVAMPIVQWIISVIGGPNHEYETVDESAWADNDKLRAALKIMQVADKIGDYSKEHPGSILADDVTAFTEAQQAFLKSGGTAEELKTLIDYINTFGVAGYMVGYSGTPGSIGYFRYTHGVGYDRSGQRGSEWAGTDPGEIPAGFYNFMMEEFGIPGERFDVLKQELEGTLSSSINELGSAFAGTLTSLPGTLASAMAAGLSGVTVQVDGVVLGHLVTPHVMANMARDVNFRRNTTTKTT